jgi:hypothetical protein
MLWSLFDKKGNIRRIGNLYIHHFEDGDWLKKETMHTHYANTFSFILKGGYVELHNNKILNRKRFSFNYTRHNEKHAITSVTENTWTLFFVGNRKSDLYVLNDNKIENRKKDRQHTYAYIFPYNEESLKYIERKRRLIKRICYHVQDI